MVSIQSSKCAPYLVLPHYQHLACTAAVDLREIDLAGRRRDHVEGACLGRAHGVAVFVGATREIRREQHHLFVAQLTAAIPVPPAHPRYRLAFYLAIESRSLVEQTGRREPGIDRFGTR